MRRFVPILIIAAVAAIAVLVGSARAASEGIEVSPSVLDEAVMQGQTLEQVFTVMNVSTADQVYYPRVRNMTGVSEDGSPIFGDEDIEGGLREWVTFSASSLAVKAGERVTVTATIRVPQSAPSGGVYGAIVFSAQPPVPSGEQSGVGVVYDVGAAVALRVGGDVVDNAAVREFRTSEKLYGSPVLSFLTKIENAGTALVRPNGAIIVRNMFGSQTATVSFNPTANGVLPGVTREYTTELAGKGLWLGRYEAELVAVYGVGTKQSLIAKTSFWVIPSKPTLIVLASIVILFAAIYWWVRSYIRRALRGSGVTSSPSGSVSFFAVFISIVVVAAIVVGIIFFLLA